MTWPKFVTCVASGTLLAILIATISLSCSDSSSTSIGSANLGGVTHVSPDPGRKIISAGWKSENLWYLTRPAHDGELAEEVVFQEMSSVGLVQGKIVFHETVLPKKMSPMPVLRPGERP